MSALSWGILGTGGIAAEFTHDLIQTGHGVSAVGSRHPESAKQFAQRHGLPKAWGSYAELVADPSVDIVYVATPPSLHASNAILALNAGKHVLVEKPFTMTAREAGEVRTVAARCGRVVLEGMWTRFLPHMIRIREIIAAGTIGDLRSLVASHNHRQTDNPAHRVNDLELGGGALLEAGIYPVAFASELFGTPATIRAVATLGPTGVDAQTSVLFAYSSGAQAMMHASAVVDGGNVATIFGTHGRIEIDETWFSPSSFTVFDDAGTVVDRFESHVPGRGLHLEAEAIERAVAAGQKSVPEMSVDESVAIMSTLDEIRAHIGLAYSLG